MADWKQITARIRRARTSKDPAGQLAALYEKTHDAMVAFELAKYFESESNNPDASKWYGTAAERFRRADWKTKALEAAVRLGGDASAGSSESASGNNEVPAPSAELPAVLVMPEPSSASEENVATFAGAGESPERADTEEDEDDSVGNRATPAESSEDKEAEAAGPESEDKRRRRRGRRGGRNRRKPGVGPQPVESATPRAASTPITSGRRGSSVPAPTVVDSAAADEPVPIRRSIPPLPIEPAPEGAGPNPRGRYGDPGLSSRMSALEMQFRRLLTCEAVKLDEAATAPAGPGVLVLSDSDLTSYYFVESCQTLRIAVRTCCGATPANAARTPLPSNWRNTWALPRRGCPNIWRSIAWCAGCSWMKGLRTLRTL